MHEYRLLPWYAAPPGRLWDAVDSDGIAAELLELERDHAIESLLRTLDDESIEDHPHQPVARLDDVVRRIEERRLVLYRRALRRRACTAGYHRGRADDSVWNVVDLADLAELPPLERGEATRSVVLPTWYEIQLVDALGHPLQDLGLELDDGEGLEMSATDADGVVRIQRPPGTAIRAALADATSTRAILEDRWSEGRDDELAGRGVLLRSLVEVARGVDLAVEQRIVVAIVPLLVRVRLIGMHFDTAKCFLLPEAMVGIRRLCEIYCEHPQARLLVVGHTDSEGTAANNTKLSIERAESVGAYLTDDVDAWLQWYGGDKPDKKRWGTREDRAMLSALPEDRDRYYERDAVGGEGARTDAAIRRFQSDHGLKVDGIAGPATRRALIGEYMAVDGTTLPAGCELTSHGCGEFFPEEATGDGQKSAENRRSEIFVFEGPIVPPPPAKTSAKGSPEYPAWRAQVTKTVDVSVEGGPVVSATLHLWLHDAMGQRMPGAPFRLATDDGEVRIGSADEEGRAVVHDFPWHLFCEVRWGRFDDADELEPPLDIVHADPYFLYEEIVFLGPEPGIADYATTLLRNLGYLGEESDARSAFAADYGADDLASIEDVHDNGRPKPLA